MVRVLVVLFSAIFLALPALAEKARLKIGAGPLYLDAKVVSAFSEVERPLMRQDWGRQEFERVLREKLPQVEVVAAASGLPYFLIAKVAMAEYSCVCQRESGRKAWLIEVVLRVLLWDTERQEELLRESFHGYTAVEAVRSAEKVWETLLRQAFTDSVSHAACALGKRLSLTVRSPQAALPSWQEWERQCVRRVLLESGQYDKVSVPRQKPPVALFRELMGRLTSAWPVTVRTNQMLFHPGEAVTVRFDSEVAGVAYLIYAGASGKIDLLIPNRAKPKMWLDKGQAYPFPAKGFGLSRLKARLADEEQEKAQDFLQIIVTQEPLPPLEDCLEQALTAGKNFASLSLDDIRRTIEHLRGKRSGVVGCVIEIVR